MRNVWEFEAGKSVEKWPLEKGFMIIPVQDGGIADEWYQVDFNKNCWRVSALQKVHTITQYPSTGIYYPTVKKERKCSKRSAWLKHELCMNLRHKKGSSWKQKLGQTTEDEW